MAKQPVVAKLFYSGAWQDRTTNVRLSDPITITRGRANEQEQAPPAQCSLTFNSHDFNPNNPLSPLYGLIGRNTPLRVELGTAHVGAGGGSAVDTTSLVAPSVVAPTSAGYLLCAWMVPDPAATITQPGTMNTNSQVTGSQATMRIGRQLLSASGATGTRTATSSASEDYASASIFVNGPTSDPTGVVSDVGGGPVSIDGTAGDWWLVVGGFVDLAAASAATELRPPAAPIDSDGGGWIPLADSGSLTVGDAQAQHLRMVMWVKQVKTTSSTHTITLPATSTVSETLMTVKRLPGAGVDPWSIRFEGEVASWSPKQTLGGPNIPPIQRVEVVAAGITRRLGQGADPLDDSVARFARLNGATAYWPLDDPPNTVHAQPAIGPHAMVVDARDVIAATEGDIPLLPVWATDQLAPWLPTCPQFERFRGEVAPSTFVENSPSMSGLVDGAATEWAVDVMLRGYPGLAPFGIVGYGEDRRLLLDSGAPGDIDVLLLSSSGIVEDFPDVAVPELHAGEGTLRHVRFHVDSSGGNLRWTVYVDGVSVATDTAASEPPFALQRVGLGGPASPAGTKVLVGQVVVWTGAVPSIADTVVAAFGHANETTDQRTVRLCDEDVVALVTVGDPALGSPAGPQHPDGFLAVLQESAETGQAILGDAREQAAVTNRPVESLYNQLPVLELDYDDDGVAPPLEPVIDDQASRNDVTAKGRLIGAERRTLDTGPMSTQPPPDGVGRVATEVTVNVASPSQLGDQAGWRVLLGTIAGTRFPQITVELTTAPAFAEAAGLVDVGDRITVDNLPATISPDLASLLCQGYTEVIGSHTRRITYNCVPYEPYQIGEVTHADYGVLQSDSAILNEDLDTTETGVSILFGAGPDWMDDGVDYDIEIGGERMTVTSVGAISGTFPNRAVGLNVTRSVNGVVKTHPTGIPIRFADRAHIGL